MFICLVVWFVIIVLARFGCVCVNGLLVFYGFFVVFGLYFLSSSCEIVV